MTSSNITFKSQHIPFRDTRHALTSLFATAELSKNFKQHPVNVEKIASGTAYTALLTTLAVTFLFTASFVLVLITPLVPSSW